MSGQNYTSALMCPSHLPASYQPMNVSTSPLNAIGTSYFLPSYTGNQTAFETMQTSASLSLTHSEATPHPRLSVERGATSVPSFDFNSLIFKRGIRRRKPLVNTSSPISYEKTIQTTGSLSLNNSSSTSDPLSSVAIRVTPDPSLDLNSSTCKQRIIRDYKPLVNPPFPPSYDKLANPVVPQPQRRMVLLGEKGVGKSSSGNTVLGWEAFETHSTSPSTSCTEIQTGEVAGRQLLVIESPAAFGAETSAGRDQQEIRQCKDLCTPGPHVFLLVMRLDKHGKMEDGAGGRIQEAFGRGALKHTMVLFTHGELLGGRPAEEHLRESLELVGECGGGHHVFNNKASDDHAQVTELLRKIDQMVLKNGGDYYYVVENERGYCNSAEQDKIDRLERMDTLDDRLELAHRDWMDNEGLTAFPEVFAVWLALLLMFVVWTLWSKFE